MKDFLFPKPTESKEASLLLLCLRILFGLMLITHGVQKLLHYTELNFIVPDPLGIGTEVSLILVLFGELFCSIAFIFGAIYRLSMIPMLIVMLVAFFHIHQGDILQGELAFIYLMVFVIMYIAGPGEYSIDAKIYKYIHAKDYEAYEY